MSRIKNILIVLLIGGVIFLWWSNERGVEDVTKPYKTAIDSLQRINFELMYQSKVLEKKVDISNVVQSVLEKRADSLAELLNKPHSCPETVKLQKKQITSLRGALKHCNEAKGVYIKQIGLCTEMNVNHKLILVNKDNMMAIDKKQFKKEKRKSFLKGAGAGGGLVLLIFLLL